MTDKLEEKIAEAIRGWHETGKPNAVEGQARDVIKVVQENVAELVDAVHHARIMATEAHLDQDGKCIIAASDFKDIEQWLLQALANYRKGQSNEKI